MIRALSPRDRKTVLGGVACIAIIVMAGKGIPFLRRWEHARVAAASEVREHVALAERASATLREIRDSAATRERALSRLRAHMIEATTPEAAAASLAAIVESLSEEEGVDVGSVALRPDSAIRVGMLRVGVRLTAEGDVDGLLGLIYAVESHETAMVVRDLSVSQPDPAAPTNRPEALRFEVHIQTLARISTRGAKAGSGGGGGGLSVGGARP